MTTNDVHSEEFESLLDPVFRSDYETPKTPSERRRKTFNSRLLGRGMMPPAKERPDATQN